MEPELLDPHPPEVSAVATAAPPAPSSPPDPARRSHGRRSKHRRRVNPARRIERPVLTPRFSCFTRNDGSIDFERTTDETVQKLAHAVKQPEARARLGLDQAATAAATAASWGKLTPHLVDTVNLLVATAAQNAWKLTDEQTAVLVLRRDPRTHAAVTDLTADVLAQYFPDGLGSHDKLVSLAVILSGFAGDCVQRIRAMRPPGEVVPFPRADGAES